MTNKYEYEEDEFSGSGGGRGSKKSTSFSGGKKGSFSNSSAYNSRLSSSKYLAATRSNNPQAMVKVASHVRGSRVKVLMEYISRTDRENGIEVEDELGIMYTGKNDIQEIYETWSEDFERAKPNAKILPRHVSHLVLSADADTTPENLNKVLDAARKTCNELIGDKGYRFLIGLHQDGGKPHAHIVVKAKSADKNIPKIRIGPAELHVMRTSFAKNLSELGLHHIATLRRDRPKEIEKIKEGKEPLKSETKNHFSHMLGNREDAEYHQALSSSVVKLRASVDTSALKDKERYYLKKSIRRFEKCLLDNPDQKREHISNLYKAFTQYRHLFDAELKAIASPNKRKTPTPDKDKIYNLIELKAYRDVKTARSDINSLDDPHRKEEKLKNLDNHSIAIINRSLSTLKDRDLPPGEIIKQFRRDVAKFQSMNKALEGTLNDKYSSISDRSKCTKEIEKLDRNLSKLIKLRKVDIESQQLTKGVKERSLKEINTIKLNYSKQREKSKDRGMGR